MTQFKEGGKAALEGPTLPQLEAGLQMHVLTLSKVQDAYERFERIFNQYVSENNKGALNQLAEDISDDLDEVQQARLRIREYMTSLSEANQQPFIDLFDEVNDWEEKLIALEEQVGELLE